LNNLKAQVVWVNQFNNKSVFDGKYTLFVDSLNSIEVEKAKLFSEIQSKAFLFPVIEKEYYSKEKDTLFSFWDLGTKYKNIKISSGNLPEKIYSEINELQNKVSFSDSKLSQLRNKILETSLNNGYPFSVVFFDSIQIDSSNIQVAVNLQTGPLFYFDSLDFAGTSELKLKYLRSFCNIKPGTLYNESFLKEVNNTLTELPYIRITRPLGVYFYGNKAKPYVYIDKKKAGNFDGIIGFAPNSSINNKLVVTGDLNLKLQNILGSGKALEIGFRSFLNSSQDLKIIFNWPYFLNTRFGIDYGFKLLKFDSLYLDLSNEMALQYRGYGKSVFKLMYHFQNVSLITVDTNSILLSKQLPPFHDIRSDLLGFSIRRNSLNNFFNPSKGTKFEVEFFAGTRKIIRNSVINDLQFSNADLVEYNLYDSLKLQTVQLKLRYNFLSSFVIYKQLVFQFSSIGGHIYNEKLFQNELFRIGGLKTLKGFDEQSIFAETFLIGNIDLKYIIAENSSFVLFYNQAYLRNSLASNFQVDFPKGFGAGMNIESKAGVFSLFYAVGSQKNNPILFNAARIHFGFVNYF
jgi:outer membrane protein assembly factor BamA